MPNEALPHTVEHVVVEVSAPAGLRQGLVRKVEPREQAGVEPCAWMNRPSGVGGHMARGLRELPDDDTPKCC